MSYTHSDEALDPDEAPRLKRVADMTVVVKLDPADLIRQTVERFAGEHARVLGDLAATMIDYRKAHPLAHDRRAGYRVLVAHTKRALDALFDARTLPDGRQDLMTALTYVAALVELVDADTPLSTPSE
jgi:hypothetical protein